MSQELKETKANYKVVAVGGVHLRSIDSIDSEPLAVIKHGESFVATKVEGLSWLRATVTQNGKEVFGYVLDAPYTVEKGSEIKSPNQK